MRHFICHAGGASDFSIKELLTQKICLGFKVIRTRRLPGIETTSGPLGCTEPSGWYGIPIAIFWVALSDLFTAVWVMASLMKVIFGKQMFAAKYDLSNIICDY